MLIQDTHDLKPGDILNCKKGNRWICVGTTEVPELGNLAYVFVRDVTGLCGTGMIKDRMWIKHAAKTETLEATFRDHWAYKREDVAK